MTKDRIYLIGHAHIDPSWLWTKGEVIHQVCPMTFRDVLKLMEEFPELKFAQSSAQLNRWMELYYPEIFAGIAEQVRAGNWEIVGGSWVEHNSNIIGDESMVRQYLLGKRYFLEKFGVDVKVGWLPDVFGFCWTMPQIFRNFGITNFLTSKLNWQHERNDPPIPWPHHVFWWEGPDGSRVLAYLTVGGYSDDVRGRWLRQHLNILKKECGISKLLVPFGRGDHGGGPLKEMIIRANRLDKNNRSTDVRFAKAISWFEDIRKGKAIKNIPVVKDELYLKTHRGTLTTEAEIKRNNRRCETLLVNAEKFSTITSLYGIPYPRVEIQSLWEMLLFGQVHDNIDGTSIEDVCSDAATDYGEIERKSRGLLDKALHSIAGKVNTGNSKGRAVVVFNPLGWSRSDTVSIPSENKLTVLDETGQSLMTQGVKDENGRRSLIFRAESIPALGYRTFGLLSGKRKAPGTRSVLRAAADSIENEFFSVRINPRTGCLESVFDKENGREVLDGSKQGNLLHIYDDKPADAPAGEAAWNINLGRMHRIVKAEQIELVERGPVRATVRVKRRYASSAFTQDVMLYAGVRRVDFLTVVDWHEHYKFLKAVFPLSVSNAYATYEIPFGYIERYDHSIKKPEGKLSSPPRSWEEADRTKSEVAALRWIDLTDENGDYGVSLLNDCKHGFCVRGNVIEMSLVRGARRGYLKNKEEWSDQSNMPIVGQHRIGYSLIPHAGGWRNNGISRAGHEFNTPLSWLFEPRHHGRLAGERSFLSVAPDNIVVSALKVAEDGSEWVLRYYEAEGRDTDAVISFFRRPKKVMITDMMETGKYIHQEPVPIRKTSVRIKTKAHKIVTLKVWL